MSIPGARRLLTFLTVVFNLWIFEKSYFVYAAPVEQTNFEIIVLHNNDIHARFQQTSSKSNKCTPKDEANNNCYGGIARIAHVIKKYRKEAEEANGIPVLYLNAGDTYTGTPWFTVFKDNITSTFLNFLAPDAISLGNHEFDAGIDGLLPFLHSANFPVLAANLDMKRTPELAAAKSLKNSTVLVRNSVKIGVIGYLTPDTKNLAYPNDLEYYPEISSINQEAAKLKNDGVNIIIALGHSGYEIDQKIAKQCPDVDIVIGGHSHSFLYTGKVPSIESAEGPYPTIVKNVNGKEVPVVQAYAYTKYLGYLRLIFNTNGDLIKFEGKPILLDGNVTQNTEVLRLLDIYKPAIDDLESSVVGYTKVTLDGNRLSCRKKECNMGNFIADSMIYARAENYDSTKTVSWTDASIAFVQGGGIRATIDKGNITREDILTVLPFQNKLYIIGVTGKMILNALEKSASNLDKEEGNGGFLQMSGLHVVYNISKPVGNRVENVLVLCSNCDIPHYEILDPNKNYKVVITEFLLFGGDGYNWNAIEPQMLEITDTEAAVAYIHYRSPVYASEEWRIVVEGVKSSEQINVAQKLTASGCILVLSILANFVQ